MIPTFVIFNTVLYDGIGDFVHFEEIIDALLKNEKFNSVKLIAFIYFHEAGTQKNFDRIERRLNSGLRQHPQRVQVHLGNLDFHKKLRTSPQLQGSLANAVKGVIISFDGLGECVISNSEGQSFVKCYAEHCLPLQKIPFVYITEHEILNPPYPKGGRGINYEICALGLYDGLSKYTFLEHSEKVDDYKNNHIYLRREEGKITYFFRNASGEIIHKYPDLNWHGGDLNNLSYYSKKEILRSMYYAAYIDDEIPYQRVCGIKLKEFVRLESCQAWNLLAQQDHTLVSQLLVGADITEPYQFMENNIVIPVYLNNAQHVIHFLCFLSNNILAKKMDGSPKNVVIYLSGCLIKSQEDLLHLFKALHRDVYDPKFDESHISNSTLDNGCNIITVICPNFSIKIFSGFYLGDAAYDAIYALSNVAVASGDNTLERCISMNIMPFYWSSNHSSQKWKTVLALQQITQHPELPLSDEARISFERFFISTQRWATINKPFRYEDPVDFPKIIEEWPIVADYLRKNMNFYTHLDEIMFSRLSSEVINQCQSQYSIDLLEDSRLLSSDELLADACTNEIVSINISARHPSLQDPRDDGLVVTDLISIELPIPSEKTNPCGFWQAICEFFKMIYDAIIRLLQKMTRRDCYSHRLFQSEQSIQNGKAGANGGIPVVFTGNQTL